MSSAQNTTAVAPNASVYYSGTYWNDFEAVRQEMNRRVSGDPHVNWHAHFQRTHPGRRFRRALVINCGNGWVERDIYRAGLFDEAVGVDYLQPLVDEATAKAAESRMPFRYYQLDINTGRFPEGDFDLVINHAGCHHIAYLDKVLRATAEVMTIDGYYINFDYVGPHRNQYPYLQWEQAHALNETLPPHLRQVMNYPHLPTMLVMDPTEAIHSELILEYTRRYFRIEQHQRVGGALAYLLLTMNRNFQAAPPEETRSWIDYVMREDLRFLQRHPELSLFDYFACTPDKDALLDRDRLRAYTVEEEARESACVDAKGHYYPLTTLQKLHLELEDLRIANHHLRTQVR